MARQVFAGDLAAFTASVATVGGIADVLVLARSVTGITAWTAKTGGTQVTDMQNTGGGSITTVSSDSNGLFEFLGPDEVYELWLDTGFGARQYVCARLASKIVSHASSLADAVLDTIVDAKGDVIVATAADTLVRLPVGADGRVLTADSGASSGVAWAPFGRDINFSVGTVAVSTGTFKWRNYTGATLSIKRVCAQVGTAPVGASILVDVNVNGTTIFTTQANRPSIASGATESSIVTNMNVTTITSGQSLTIDVDQVGSTTPGANLAVQVELCGD